MARRPIPAVTKLVEALEEVSKTFWTLNALAEFFRSGPFKAPVGFKAFPLKATPTRRTRRARRAKLTPVRKYTKRSAYWTKKKRAK